MSRVHRVAVLHQPTLRSRPSVPPQGHLTASAQGRAGRATGPMKTPFLWKGARHCHQAMLAPRSLPLPSGMPSASFIWPRTSWYRAQAAGGWEEGERVGRVLREGGAAARMCVHVLPAPAAAAQRTGTATWAAPGAPVPPCGAAVQLAKPARP